MGTIQKAERKAEKKNCISKVKKKINAGRGPFVERTVKKNKKSHSEKIVSPGSLKVRGTSNERGTESFQSRDGPWNKNKK